MESCKIYPKNLMETLQAVKSKAPLSTYRSSNSNYSNMTITLTCSLIIVLNNNGGPNNVPIVLRF